MRWGQRTLQCERPDGRVLPSGKVFLNRMAVQRAHAPSFEFGFVLSLNTQEPYNLIRDGSIVEIVKR